MEKEMDSPETHKEKDLRLDMIYREFQITYNTILITFLRFSFFFSYIWIEYSGLNCKFCPCNDSTHF